MRTLSLIAVLLLAAGCDSSSSVAEADSTVIVAYEGRLEDGTVFDQRSREALLLEDAIPGFRDGVVGMAVGETRTFTVPPERGFGDEPRFDRDGNVVVPANSTLIFEVTLLDIR